MSYRLPNLSIEQYRLLPADEQYLLISSIHALYERMLGAPSVTPALQLVPPPAPAPEPIPAAPVATRARRQKNGIRNLILKAFENSLGRRIELTTDEIYASVSATTPYSSHGVRSITHRLYREGVIERVGRAKYRLT